MRILIIALSTIMVTTTADPDADEVLVLQLEVSHPKNVDQESVIFNKDHVEFVTNVSLPSPRNGTHRPRLGRFWHSYNTTLKLLKRKVIAYKNIIASRKTRRTTSFAIIDQISTKIERNISQNNPHPATIRLGGDGRVLEVEEENPHFKILRGILSDIKRTEWKCRSCAEYTKKGHTITRTTKRDQETLSSTDFPLNRLGCRRHGKEDGLECIDAQFGIFEI